MMLTSYHTNCRELVQTLYCSAHQLCGVSDFHSFEGARLDVKSSQLGSAPDRPLRVLCRKLLDMLPRSGFSIS